MTTFVLPPRQDPNQPDLRVTLAHRARLVNRCPCTVLAGSSHGGLVGAFVAAVPEPRVGASPTVTKRLCAGRAAPGYWLQKTRSWIVSPMALGHEHGTAAAAIISAVAPTTARESLELGWPAIPCDRLPSRRYRREGRVPVPHSRPHTTRAGLPVMRCPGCQQLTPCG